MSSPTIMKRTAAEAALPLVDRSAVLGVGSGTTVNEFIRILHESGLPPRGAVAASLSSAKLLDEAGITVFPLAEVVEIPVYVDGADEIDPQGRMIKGGGGAHAMEKRISAVALRFVCIADESKLVDRLGEEAAVPLEVLPSQLAHVTKEIAGRGAQMDLRQQRSDAGNLLVDVSGLDLANPEAVERELEAIPGVVACGVFAIRPADIAFIGTSDGGVRELTFGR